MLMADINMAELFDYDVPSDCPEWFWVTSNATFSCKDNGESGVWDFVLNTTLEYDDIPPALAPIINQAIEANINYILFHQGC